MSLEVSRMPHTTSQDKRADTPLYLIDSKSCSGKQGKPGRGCGASLASYCNNIVVA